MENKTSLPWSFKSASSFRFAGSAFAITIGLIPVLMYDPQKSSLAVVAIFEAFLAPFALFLLNLTFVDVRCSTEGIDDSGLFFRGKNIFWGEITKIELLPGYRSGYSIRINSKDKKISVGVQMHRKEDILTFIDLLKKKATKAKIDIDLDKIEGSYF